ncbi:hypothetical protein F2P81_014556 [Scophthalmus maximus]|uniref:Uncharacterized protein n=1 Tax=Scophthalmus maximus TaxID=52904 RepID=A0A6A4SAP2_SCOMX|nr:hypothetical protein F2P81_014556 [Scophthalmus maximus]
MCRFLQFEEEVHDAIQVVNRIVTQDTVCGRKIQDPWHRQMYVEDQLAKSIRRQFGFISSCEAGRSWSLFDGIRKLIPKFICIEKLFLGEALAQMTKTRCRKSVKASGRQAFALVP